MYKRVTTGLTVVHVFIAGCLIQEQCLGLQLREMVILVVTDQSCPARSKQVSGRCVQRGMTAQGSHWPTRRGR